MDSPTVSVFPEVLVSSVETAASTEETTQAPMLGCGFGGEAVDKTQGCGRHIVEHQHLFFLTFYGAETELLPAIHGNFQPKMRFD